MDKCSGCHRSIYHLINNNTRKLAPIDADPTPDGNILIDLEAREYSVFAGPSLELLRSANTPLHKNHFATCPVDYKFRSEQGGESVNQRLGATGEYPDGKLNSADEGELRITVGVEKGKIVMSFGKPVEWIGLTPEIALAVALSLYDKATAVKAIAHVKG
jgi:hypothetical protein